MSSGASIRCSGKSEGDAAVERATRRYRGGFVSHIFLFYFNRFFRFNSIDLLFGSSIFVHGLSKEVWRGECVSIYFYLFYYILLFLILVTSFVNSAEGGS